MRVALFCLCIAFLIASPVSFTGSGDGAEISAAYGAPVLEDCIYTEDFESGAVGPWASYPPSQDTAYDPSIHVLPLLSEKNVKNRALWREITPDYDIDYEFGARKLLDMYVDSSSVLTFRAFVKSYRGTKGVMVRFGFGNGVMKERLVPFDEIQVWKDCTVRLADILPAGVCKKVDGIAFMAVCPNADPETLLRFGLDDVKLTGKRERPFVFTAPKVHKLDEWKDHIAGTHFTAGGTVTISGTAPVETGKVQVRLVRALTGGDERQFSMKRTSGGQWSVTIPLDEKSGTGPGFWRATVSLADKNGGTFSTSLVFLVRRKDAPDDHPRLYYSHEDMSAIRGKMSSGRGKTVWEAIRSRADRARAEHTVDDFAYKFDALNDIHWLPVFGDYGREIREPQDYIRENALVYALSGDAGAGDAARGALLKMAEWPSYVPPHILNQGKHSYYITGIMLTDLALGYDLLYDRLTPEERKTVAE
ncbi:hypothetical protein LLG96_06670, partial [bacterium]|nr:hypothetical protein [bacterium]